MEHEAAPGHSDSEEQAQLIGAEGKGEVCPKRHHQLLEIGKAAVYCILYLCIGPTLILVNRSILKDQGFKFPMALSGLGLVFSSLVSFVLVRVTGTVPLEHSELVTPHFFLTSLMPVGAAMASTLAAGNAVYLHLPVGFIQMLKAFTPTVTLIFLWLFNIEKPSCRVVGATVFICVGTALASIGEGSLSLVGLSLMLLAEVSEALRLVLTQKLLQNLKFGVIEGQYFLAPVSALWLLSASAAAELPRAIQTHAFTVPLKYPWVFLLSAGLGFFVNIATFLVIKATSSVTLKVLGTARNAGLVIFSTVFLGEKLTAVEVLGYTISLLAFGFYNYFKLTKQ